MVQTACIKMFPDNKESLDGIKKLRGAR